MEKCRKIILFLAPLVYVAMLSFSLSDEWFPADDGQELAFVRNADSVVSLLGADVFGLFRPIKNLLFLAFVRILPFVGIRGCRTLGIALGVISFFPVLTLCRRILGNEWKALLSASVWLLAPTLVSSVAWPSCINIQIMVSFVALALVFHDDAWTGIGIRFSRIVLACVFFFFSLVSYECAIALLPILFLFDLLLRPGRIRTKEYPLVGLVYILTAAVYMTLRYRFNAATGVDGSFEGVRRWQLIITSPYFAAQHFASWFWPFGRMTVGGSYKWGQTSWMVLSLCTALFVIFLVFAIAERRRLSVLSFSILFSLFSFAPVSNCLGFGNGPYGDYYLTLASIGLAIGTVELCSILLRVSGRLRSFALVVVVAFAVARLLAVPEMARWSRLWGRGEEALEESSRNFPVAFSNKIMLAQLYFDRREYEKSAALCNEVKCLVGVGSRWTARIDLIQALQALVVEKDPNKALDLLAQSERVADGRGDDIRNRHYYRGCVYEDLKADAETAEREYELALSGKWNIDSVPCADRLARLKAMRGERDEAIALWERAMRLDPENIAVLWNLSIAYRESGEIDRSDALRKKVTMRSGERRQ